MKLAAIFGLIVFLLPEGIKTSMQTTRWQWAQWFEIRWWRWYLKRKPVDNYLQSKKRYWDDFLWKNGISLPQNQRILDAGCGPAGIFMQLKNHEVIALDPLLEEYKLMRHFDPAWYPWTQFDASTLESFAGQEKFDVVFCLNVINHVADLKDSMHRLFLSLKVGGELVLSVDVHRRPWLKPIFQLIPGDVLHPHQYDLSDYQFFLAEAGFSNIKYQILKQEFIFDYVCFTATK